MQILAPVAGSSIPVGLAQSVGRIVKVSPGVSRVIHIMGWQCIKSPCREDIECWAQAIIRGYSQGDIYVIPELELFWSPSYLLISASVRSIISYDLKPDDSLA